MLFLISSFKEIILTQHVGLDLLKRFSKLDRFVVVKHFNVVMKWSKKTLATMASKVEQQQIVTFTVTFKF
jgi:hypothetical protein